MLANFGNFLFEVNNILLGLLFDLTEGMSTNICNFWCWYIGYISATKKV